MEDTAFNIEKPVVEQLMAGGSPLLDRIRRNNRLILHNYSVPVEKNYTCQLDGCGQKINIRLIPNQIVYPKYCQHHRTEHRRKHCRKTALQH